MPKSAATTAKTRVELISAANAGKFAIDKETADWIGGLDEAMYAKLVAVGLVPKRAEAEQTTLGGFIDALISERSDVKGSTAIVYGHTRRCLVKFFKADKPLSEITPGDADSWRRYLAREKPTGEKEPRGEGLSANTVRRRCAIVRRSKMSRPSLGSGSLTEWPRK